MPYQTHYMFDNEKTDNGLSGLEWKMRAESKINFLILELLVGPFFLPQTRYNIAIFFS